MAYDRYLDIHLCDNFDTPTFAKDVKEQQQHQIGKIGANAYRKMEVPGLTIKRRITNSKEQIAWVCAGTSSKIRINAHGSGSDGKLTDGRGFDVKTEDLADFLIANGLTPGQKGGLQTINLAACEAAHGPQERWIIKLLADRLKLPGVQFTGAPSIVRMDNGVLQVRVAGEAEPFNHHNTHKKTYTYA
jgi:hypothetical protein